MSKKIIYKLISSIERSELAYNMYKERKLYYQAKRIYKANMLIYKYLVEYSESENKKFRSDIFNYIFHLEDWFENFHHSEISMKPNPQSEFAFSSFQGAIPFPRGFVNKLKSGV